MGRARTAGDGTVLLVIKGMLIGVANIIPGVSGGTFALVLGIYDRLIGALNAIGGRTVRISLRMVTGPHRADRREAFVEELRRIDLWFLVRLGGGAVVAIFALSEALDWLLVNQPGLTLAFFVGLIVPSIAVPWRMMERRAPATLLWALPGAAVTVGVSFAFSGDYAGSDNPALVFASGAAAISAMILPGVSGSFVMLVVGQYQNVLAAIQGVRRLEMEGFVYAAVFGLGCVVGLLLFARLLAWVLRRFRSATLAFLVGLVLGSFWVLWPFKDFDEGATVSGRDGEEKTEIRIATAPNQLPESPAEAGGSGLAFVVGLGCAIGVDRLGRARKSDDGEGEDESDPDRSDGAARSS